MKGPCALLLLSAVASACAARPPTPTAVAVSPTSAGFVSSIPGTPDFDLATTTTPAGRPSVAFITVSESVNVRSGPGTDWEVLGQLSPGREYPVKGRSDDGDWLQIQFGDQVAWVYAAYTRLSGDLQGIPGLPSTPATPAAVGPMPVDQRAAAESIRQITHQPDLVVLFIGMTTMINSPNGDLSVASYRDDLGREYLVETGHNRVVEIDPTGTFLSSLPDGPTLTESELRMKAMQIVSENTPGFDGMRDGLHYEEGTKDGRLYFFRWDDRNAVGWRSMRPFAQVGLYLTGELVSYFNTLFLE